jgi:hypothetical protein
MIKDLLVSFKENFKDKTRNPFLGTYLMVWLIRNWELVYTLFNFDNDIKLKGKIDFIKKYYTDNNFIENLWTNSYWAFALLVLTYILLNLSRLIVNSFEKKLTPWIYKVTDSKSIVLKETYNNLKSENNLLELNLEKERESKGRLQVEITKLEQKIEKLNTPISANENSNKETNPENKKSENEVDVMFNKIKAKKWLNEYLEANRLVSKSENGWVSNNDIDESFDYFITLGMFDVAKDDDQDTNMKISDLGNKVLRKVRLEL